MRNIEEIIIDIENAFNEVMKVIKEKDSDCFNKKFERAVSIEEAFKKELKDYVIHSYKGHEKFSQEVLSCIYDTTLSNIEEYSSSKIEFPAIFKENMKVVEMAYNDGLQKRVWISFWIVKKLYFTLL